MGSPEYWLLKGVDLGNYGLFEFIFYVSDLDSNPLSLHEGFHRVILCLSIFFVLCIEVLTQEIRKSVAGGFWHRLPLFRQGPLLFYHSLVMIWCSLRKHMSNNFLSLWMC